MRRCSARIVFFTVGSLGPVADRALFVGPAKGETMNHTTTAALGLFAAMAFGATAALANDRQTCINDCTTAGTTQHQQCNAAYRTEMIRCGTLTNNKDRNTCKAAANDTQKQCNEAARAKVKQCQADCPPKQK
jgi:hypothetical protein